jgi:hypothetical protein
MNGNMQILLEEIAQESGAVVKCEVCQSNYVIADDDEAESRAYGMVTNAWKRGEFRSATREEAVHEMKLTLQNANHRCPSCRI